MNEAERALALLRERGWCRGQWENERGELCIAGALALGCGKTPAAAWFNDKRSALVMDATCKVIDEQYGTNYVIDEQYGTNYVNFNDGRGTTFADVERVLEKTAVRLDEVVD